MLSEAEIKNVKEAIPILRKIVKLGDIPQNPILSNAVMDAKKALEDAERCERFDIWVMDRTFDYGIGIYVMEEISNVANYKGGEELLKISFPTGAYIFGDRYDTFYFNQFYAELHYIKPDYEDCINHALYYKPENARKAYEHYLKTYKMYVNGNKERAKQYRIEKLEKELEALKSEEGADNA